MNTLKQKIIIARIRKGDSAAFRELYDIFSDKIYRFVFFRLPNEQDAKDLLQEIFLSVWDYLNKDDVEVKNLQALIYKITKNSVSNYYVKNKLRLSEVGLDEVEYKIGESDETSEVLDIRLEIEKVSQHLKNLKRPEYQEVIELKYISGLSHKEISKILDKTEQNVRTILHRAIKNLKQKIEESNSNEK